MKTGNNSEQFISNCFYSEEKLAVFIDGANLYAAAKSLEFDIDYKRLLSWISGRSRLVRAFYYTALMEEQEYKPGFEGATERLICELFYATGMRRNELQQLKETDIEWSLNQVRILGKGNKERLVPVSPVLLDSIRDYMEEKRKLEKYDENYLFNTKTGKPLYAVYIYRVVNHYLSNTTTLQKKSPHVLRHTFATHLLNNGANIQAIKDLLGHSSLAATQVYTHNNIDKLKEIHRNNHPRG